MTSRSATRHVVDASRIYHTSALGLFTCLYKHRDLAYEMIRRTVAGRYRGSLFGMAWSLAYPLMMLMVYTFVFGIVFKARFGDSTGAGAGTAGFAITLFSGLIVHAFFSECMVRSPGLITGNSQYVKKVVFPLEILPWVAVGSALFQALMSITVLTLFLVVLKQVFHFSMFLTPLVFAPLAIMGAGVAWFLSALSVYLRDIGQVVAVLSTMLLFLSPIFYPVTALPEWAQTFIYLNPLSFPIEQFRNIAVHGEPLNWFGLLVYTIVAYLVAVAGYSWFQRLRPGFADVL